MRIGKGPISLGESDTERQRRFGACLILPENHFAKTPCFKLSSSKTVTWSGREWERLERNFLEVLLP